MASDTSNTKQKDDMPWMAAFLEALSEVPNVTRACKVAGVSRMVAYKHRGENEDFKLRWDAHLALGYGAAEDEGFRRAMEGTDKPVFHLGVQVGTIKEYSDTMLIFMLKGNLPDKYNRPERRELSAPGGGPIPIVITKMDMDEL